MAKQVKHAYLVPMRQLKEWQHYYVIFLSVLTSTLLAFLTKKSVKIYLVYLITYAILNYLH